MQPTVETWLQGSMLASTSFTVILIHNERPRLSSVSECLGNSWYRIRCWAVIVVKSNINFSVFVVDGLVIDWY